MKKCPACSSDNLYPDGAEWVCAECTHTWSGEAPAPVAEAAVDKQVRDAFGNVLADGDAVTLVKDLKIKGAGAGIKVGAKIRNIRLIDSVDGHNIACKVDGVGAIYLKSEFVKKA